MRKVMIFGGTHGNERTGVALVEHWKECRAEVDREGLDIRFVLSNPAAVAENRRYIGKDLNRCFQRDDLGNPDLNLPEQRRAREILEEVESFSEGEECCIFDLHTTNANMGPTVILTSMNRFNLWLCAYVQERMPGLRICHQVLEESESHFLNSLSPFGFCVEVGPAVQGCLDHRIVTQTREIISLALDGLSLYAKEGAEGVLTRKAAQDVKTYRYLRTLDYPRDAAGRLLSYIHPDLASADFEPIQSGAPVFLNMAGETIRLELQEDEPETVWPIFVGEAAYVEQGVALVLTEQVSWSWALEGECQP